LARAAKQHRVRRKGLIDKPSFLNPNSLISAGLLGFLLIAYIAAVYVFVVALGTLPFGERPDDWRPLDQQWYLNLFAFILLALTIVPVSRWLYQRVNDLVYAQHDNPYALAAAINQQLQAMSNPRLTLPLVVETIATTLHLPYAGVEFQYLDTAEQISFGTPPEHAQTRQFMIAYLEQRLGVLLVSDRASSRPLTESDTIVLKDIAQQMGTALYVAQLTAELQSSRERLIVSREEERRRIRNDLHDGLAPSLSSFQLQLSALRILMEQNPAEAHKMIEELSGDMREATGEIRRLVYDLRPPMLDDLGLVAAIKHIKLPPSSLRLEVTAPDPMPPLPAATEVAVYRIASEAIHNVVKHAQATCCTVTIDVQEMALILSVCDDGQGQAADYAGGIGVQSMQERAAELGGTFAIQAYKDDGTCVEVRLPLEAA
jgi:two-component system NarL family sensor kinase